jgi:hypothetical protein
VDLPLVLGPPFLAVGAVLCFRERLAEATSFPLWAWVCLVLWVDVAHVYGTLYRTYFDPRERAARGRLLSLVPLAGWLAGVIFYTVDPLYFWRALAYLAVFHFVRQQYGFLRLYSRREAPDRHRWLDAAVIYLAALYPLLYWHTHLPRNFQWFVDGDFVAAFAAGTDAVAGALYLVALVLYVGKELRRPVNLPKQLVVVGTALSWYVGIVLLNGDLAFTLTNVVSHGVPYIALVWISRRRSLFSWRFLPLYLGSLLLFAFLEEGLWDGLVWRERLSFFKAFGALPRIDDPATLAWLVPLLALPQITHYVLDGFIWRVRDV